MGWKINRHYESLCALGDKYVLSILLCAERQTRFINRDVRWEANTHLRLELSSASDNFRFSCFHIPLIHLLYSVFWHPANSYGVFIVVTIRQFIWHIHCFHHPLTHLVYSLFSQVPAACTPKPAFCRPQYWQWCRLEVFWQRKNSPGHGESTS